MDFLFQCEAPAHSGTQWLPWGWGQRATAKCCWPHWRGRWTAGEPWTSARPPPPTSEPTAKKCQECRNHGSFLLQETSCWILWYPDYKSDIATMVKEVKLFIYWSCLLSSPQSHSHSPRLHTRLFTSHVQGFHLKHSHVPCVLTPLPLLLWELLLDTESLLIGALLCLKWVDF